QASAFRRGLLTVLEPAEYVDAETPRSVAQAGTKEKPDVL
ncbi:hypothetical protein HMPREF3036_02399, partial [Sutterella sp. KLE1602]